MVLYDTAGASATLTLNAGTVTGAPQPLPGTSVTPVSVGLVVVVSGYAAGGSTYGFNVIVQSASSSSGTFGSTPARINQITANGTYTIPVAGVNFRNLRVLLQRNDGAPTATVTCYWLLDTVQNVTPDSPLLTNTRVLLAANAIAVATNVDTQPSVYGAGDPGSLRVVFTSTVTAGSVSVQLYGSVDGTTYWAMPQGTAGGPQSTNGEAQVVISSTGVASLTLAGAIPPYLRATLTPAGFTGTVAVDLVSDAFLIA